eukprot:TRINITY_DN41703_c0_g1_i1.p1 TRINITY_DN41703_c0_g1~~TRINITY_DN41703_c0_g1_i1.p1  ORF type:complete len:102 (-),score=4.16 TRINITY_DN41703_c0_g1_i1:3-308(-)
MLAAGVGYQVSVKEPGHRRGRSWVYCFFALARILLTRSDISSNLRKLLDVCITNFDSPKKVARVVRHCTAKRQRDAKRVTITLHIKSRIEGLSKEIFNYLE